jgi:hypothetical protein
MVDENTLWHFDKFPRISFKVFNLYLVLSAVHLNICKAASFFYFNIANLPKNWLANKLKIKGAIIGLTLTIHM